jgi:hypothetical protein
MFEVEWNKRNMGGEMKKIIMIFLSAIAFFIKLNGMSLADIQKERYMRTVLVPQLQEVQQALGDYYNTHKDVIVHEAESLNQLQEQLQKGTEAELRDEQMIRFLKSSVDDYRKERKASEGERLLKEWQHLREGVDASLVPIDEMMQSSIASQIASNEIKYAQLSEVVHALIDAPQTEPSGSVSASPTTQQQATSTFLAASLPRVTKMESDRPREVIVPIIEAERIAPPVLIEPTDASEPQHASKKPYLTRTQKAALGATVGTVAAVATFAGLAFAVKRKIARIAAQYEIKIAQLTLAQRNLLAAAWIGNPALLRYYIKKVGIQKLFNDPRLWLVVAHLYYGHQASVDEIERLKNQVARVV